MAEGEMHMDVLVDPPPLPADYNVHVIVLMRRPQLIHMLFQQVILSIF